MNFPPTMQFIKDGLIIKFNKLTTRRDNKAPVRGDYIYQPKEPRKGKISGELYAGSKDGQTLALSLEQIQTMINNKVIKIL